MIKVDPSSFFKGMVKLEDKVKVGITLQAKIAADKMAIDAKTNAPWIDRTGNARQSIRGYTEWVNNHTLNIGISGGMDYSPYLEFCNNKKYAILYPTLLKHKNDIVDSMGAIIK